MIRARTFSVAVVSLALVFSACSATKSSDSTVAPTDSAAPVSDLPATVPPTTVESTTLPPTTVPEPPPFLRSDGIGVFDFGAPYEGFEAGIPLVVDSNDGGSFPVDSGLGYYESDSGEDFFYYPRGRTVCWDDGTSGYLCAYFGGPDVDTLVFVGWDYASAVASGTLFSESGVTVNALVSATPVIPVPDGACYSYTSVVVDGITVDLISGSGEFFGEYAADGSFVLAVPQPADARVSLMSAGERPFGFGGDC